MPRHVFARGLLGEGVPVDCMVEFELVSSSELSIKLLGRCELCQVWVETDLFTSDGVHGTADDSKECVDPPPNMSASSGEQRNC
jgi:hypothetical protein